MTFEKKPEGVHSDLSETLLQIFVFLGCQWGSQKGFIFDKRCTFLGSGILMFFRSNSRSISGGVGGMSGASGEGLFFIWRRFRLG